MSSRRQMRRIQRSPAVAATTIAADELVSRLRALLPPGPAAAAAPSTAQVLEETCAYIRRLHAEADGLADRLARLLAAEEDSPTGGGADGDAAAQLIIRALLM